MPRLCYECVYCRELHSSKEEAIKCENRHLKKILGWEIGNYWTQKMLSSRYGHPCDFCKNAYYVYGCEWDCELYKEGKCHAYYYEEFKPIKDKIKEEFELERKN